MTLFKSTKNIFLITAVFSLTFGSYLTASAITYLTVKGIAPRDGEPVGEGYEVNIASISLSDESELFAAEPVNTNANGAYSGVLDGDGGTVAEVGDVIKADATDPDTGKTAMGIAIYNSGDRIRVNIEFSGNRGTIIFLPEHSGYRDHELVGDIWVWVYLLAWNSGEVMEWTYQGSDIFFAGVEDDTTADVAGWDIGFWDSNEVTFVSENNPLADAGYIAGFWIASKSEQGAKGDWICHDNFGRVIGPLPVVLSSFTAHYNADNSGVILKWRTESEINNLGFDVYRGESLNDKFVKINSAYIKGIGTDATSRGYQFNDENAVVGKNYYYYIENISFSGEREKSPIIKVTNDESHKMSITKKMGKINATQKPTEFSLLQNFPNPFNPETWIPFHLSEDVDVTIRIFDLRGQEIRTIHLGQMPVGYYDGKGKAVSWDGRDSYGQKVSSGMYFYQLTAGEFHATKKLTIIK